MQTIRIIAGAALLAAAMMAGFFFVARETGIARTIEHTRLIDREFKEALKKIADIGIEAVGVSLPQRGADWVMIMVNGYDSCDEPPSEFKNSTYILGVWRGEWLECYSPESGASTLDFDADVYSMFGSLAKDRVIILGFIFLTLLLALWILIGIPRPLT